MNQSLKDSWIAALRSGQYSQCRYRLHNQNDTRCCLGVLCAVAGETSSSLSEYYKYYFYDGQSGDLTTALREKFGLSDIQHNCLTRLNDAERFTFDQIADWIEQNI